MSMAMATASAHAAIMDTISLSQILLVPCGCGNRSEVSTLSVGFSGLILAQMLTFLLPPVSSLNDIRLL